MEGLESRDLPDNAEKVTPPRRIATFRGDVDDRFASCRIIENEPRRAFWPSGEPAPPGPPGLLWPSLSKAAQALHRDRPMRGSRRAGHRHPRRRERAAEPVG